MRVMNIFFFASLRDGPATIYLDQPVLFPADFPEARRIPHAFIAPRYHRVSQQQYIYIRVGFPNTFPLSNPIIFFFFCYCTRP